MSKIPDLMIERAAELWARKLQNPTFDNGDQSNTGFMTMMLATVNIQNDKENVEGGMALKIEEFRHQLIIELKNSRDKEYFEGHSLSVDYHPCRTLTNVAEKVGIPLSQFSCKSTVYIQDDRVVTSFGYGKENMSHYPLSKGGWLLTTLNGSDISKIIKHVEDGNSMGFEVELPG